MTNTEILSYLDIPHGYPRKRTDIFGRSTEDCPEGICISILNDHLHNLVDKQMDKYEMARLMLTKNISINDLVIKSGTKKANLNNMLKGYLPITDSVKKVLNG